MQKRVLGKTGEHLSIVGFGGICVMNVDKADSDRMVGEAVDLGVNYFDVAPTYGNAQERLGPALQPYRDGVFLACKTGERTKAGAEKQLQDSLRMLKTDRFDLYQFHGVMTEEEVDTIIGPGGAMEAFLDARRKGYIRFIGFSAHSEEAALKLMDAFAFDSILFPINWAAWLANDFGPRVVAKAKEQGVGILALKALCKRAKTPAEQKVWEKAWYWPVDTYEEAELGLRFTLSQGATAAVSPGHYELFRWAAAAGEHFTPIRDDEVEMLREKAEQIQTIFPIKK